MSEPRLEPGTLPVTPRAAVYLSLGVVRYIPAPDGPGLSIADPSGNAMVLLSLGGVLASLSVSFWYLTPSVPPTPPSNGRYKIVDAVRYQLYFRGGF